MLNFHRTFLTATQQVLLVVLLLIPSVSSASSPIESLNIIIDLDNLGTAHITQQIKYSSPSKLDWQIFSRTDNLTIETNGQLVEKTELKTNKNQGVFYVESVIASTNWKISYSTTDNLIRHNNRDQLFLKIFDEPIDPIFLTIIDFNLPDTVKETNLSGNIYSLSGVSNPKSELVSSTNMNFSAGYAGTKSLLTISSNWDKNILLLNSLQQAKLSLLQLDIAPWLVFGGLLPLASLLVLLHLLWRQKKQEGSTEKVIDKPPSDTSAVLVGVLVRKKIYPEEIAALIISLCQRGYLIIVKRSDNYFITKRKELDENVEKWERSIIDEMFGDEKNIETSNLRSLNNNSLYSPKVRDAFTQIYEVITNSSYFSENPHITRIKNKLFALVIYYLSAIAIVWIAVSSANPYLILPLAGAMVVAQVIIKLSVKLANYTEKGIATRTDWLAFRNYLNIRKPLPFEASRNHKFDKYLPYAVAMNSTLAWAKRFDLSSTIIIKPDWFVTYGENSTVEFAKEIALFTEKISIGITNLRGPLVS